MKKLSVIIPFYNEEENVLDVLGEIKSLHPQIEIVAVDDGSTDRTGALIRGTDGVELVTHRKNLGQSAALFHGLQAAVGEICVMMDGDGQNDPADIEELVRGLDTHDVCCGFRKNRKDTWQKKAASRFANLIRRSLLDDGILDTGCTLKAMKKLHVKHLIPFNGMHRFMPALLKNAGLSIKQIPVNHRPRLRGTSKYTVAGRAVRGLWDLVGVRWLMSRQIRWEIPC